MRIIIINIFMILLVLKTDIYGQSTNNNCFIKDAMNKGVIEFLNQKALANRNFMVLRMKVMKIKKKKGEFVLSYILNDNSYESIDASHYIFVDNMLVLIRVDSLSINKIENCGINAITDSIENVAFNILAGPNYSITAQLAPMMVFKHKCNKVKGKFYNGIFNPNKKYWF